jgi:hypothetical protein
MYRQRRMAAVVPFGGPPHACMRPLHARMAPRMPPRPAPRAAPPEGVAVAKHALHRAGGAPARVRGGGGGPARSGGLGAGRRGTRGGCGRRARRGPGGGGRGRGGRRLLLLHRRVAEAQPLDADAQGRRVAAVAALGRAALEHAAAEAGGHHQLARRRVGPLGRVPRGEVDALAEGGAQADARRAWHGGVGGGAGRGGAGRGRGLGAGGWGLGAGGWGLGARGPAAAAAVVARAWRRGGGRGVAAQSHAGAQSA